MLIEPFQKALPILRTLTNNGYEAFFVGGSVRDFLMNRSIGDVDIATSALPEKVQALFDKTIPVGIEHGTVVVVQNGEQFEVTTFRREGKYEDFRRPNEVDFITSIKEDLSRRDFTINAIAMNMDEQLYDPFGGQQAISDKKIETVGQAEERFKEDPLRVMRAVRFVSQLDFTLEKETQNGMIASGHMLEKISVERITIEFQKMMHGKAVKRALRLLIETNLYKYLPSLSDKKHALMSLSNIDFSKLKTESEIWSLLINVINEKDSAGLLKQWKLSNKIIKDVEQITKALQYLQKNKWTNQLLFSLGKALSCSVAKLHSILTQTENDTDTILEQYELLPIKDRRDLNVTGNDILLWVKKDPGPWMKEMIEDIQNAVLDKKVNNSKEDIKRWLESCNQM